MHFLTLSAFAAVAYLLYKREITIGTGDATLGYIESFIYPIREILNDINSINGSKEVRNEIIAFLNQPTANTILCKDFNKEISIENVSINYENFCINNLNLVFEKGKKYVIIGHSGSGKSSTIKAISKSLNLSSGKIKIDNKDIDELDLSTLIACVNQTENLFLADFLSNISIFDTYKTDNIKSFSKLMDLKTWESIASSENCSTLSGGEKQITSILRALNMETPILLLDEPYSAIDIKTAKKINDYLLSLKDKTIILITHKISFEELKNFDMVILMDNGTVVNFDNPENIFSLKEFRNMLGE